MSADQLTTAEVAELAGIAPESVYRYRIRGAVPEPDGYIGRTPWWHRETIETWLGHRKGPGRPKQGE